MYKDYHLFIERKLPAGGILPNTITQYGKGEQYYEKYFIEEASGADAVIAVRYATSSIMQGTAEVMAYGTAVKYIN